MPQAIDKIALKTIEGAPATLGDYRGEVLLVVNVASKCGLTPQYAGLEALYQDKKALGFKVLGFPANNFLAQEPGSDSEIREFCSLTYNVSFPMFSKISVAGSDCHPLYVELTRLQPDAIGEGPFRERLTGKDIPVTPKPQVLWNFEKFLIDREGQVVARFSPDVSPEDPRLHAAIEQELARHA